jgi:alkanesulfonate monooxygenase SsuD/methylene tetrahydromethanopterin reductase-like flavin-dependent oxidoreductase (luciferase family)
VPTTPAVAVLLIEEGMPLPEIVDYAVSLEDVGFAAVWHEEIFPEPFLPLAAIAARTQRIRLGAAISNCPRTPVSSALTAANLDQISAGRYVHGVGRGPAAWNEQYHGIRYEHPMPRMREFIEAIRAAWRVHSGRMTSYDGRWYRLVDYARPLRQEREDIPLALAAVRRNMLRLGDSHADAVIFNVLTIHEYYRDYALPHLATGAEAAGRDPAQIERLALGDPRRPRFYPRDRGDPGPPLPRASSRRRSMPCPIRWSTG